MRLSRLFILTIIVSIPVILILWLSQAGGGLADDLTFVLLILLSITLIAFLQVRLQRTKTLMLVLVLVVSLSFLQRTILLLIYPKEFNFGFLRTPTHDDLNRTLLYVILGTIAAGSGIVLSSMSFLRPHPAHQTKRDIFFESRRYLLGYALFSLMITFLLARFGQIALSGGASSSWGFLVRIFDVDVFLFVPIIYLQVYSRRMTRGERWAAILYCLGYLALTIFRGQRSGIVTIFFSWFFCLLVRKVNPKISRTLMFTGILAFVLFAGFIYYFAFSVRYTWLTTGSLSPIVILSYYKYFLSLGPSAILFELSNHVGMTDRLLAVVNNWAGDVSAFARLDIPLLIILKGFIPSFFFLPNMISLSRAFAFLFRGVPLSVVHAESWSGLGAAYGYFGWWGGLAAVLIGTFVSALIYQRMAKGNSGLSLFVSATFLYGIIYSGLTTGYFEEIIPEVIRGFILIGGISLIAAHLSRPTGVRPSKSSARTMM